MTELERLVFREKSPLIINLMDSYCRCLGYSPEDSEIIAGEWFSMLHFAILNCRKRTKEKANETNPNNLRT
jgi:hypothetical protein